MGKSSKKKSGAKSGAKETDYGRELYELMIRKGYPEDFSRLVSAELHTEFTGKRMIGYIAAREGALPLDEVADEMMAILSDRERLIKKHISENAQSYINEMYRDDFFEEEESDALGGDAAATINEEN